MRFLANLTNFLTGFVAVVLSFALVLALMTVPLLVMVHELLEPEILHELLISASQNLSDESSGDTQAAMMQKLMESQAVRDLLGLYIEDMFAALDGRRVLTTQALQELLEKHMDELMPVFRELIMADAESVGEVSDMELEFVVSTMLYGYAELLLEQLPTAAQLGITPVNIVPPDLSAESLAAYWDSIWILDGEALERLSRLELQRDDFAAFATQGLVMLQNSRGLHLLCLLILMLSLLILVFRLGSGFSCFSWLAVVYFIAGAIVVALPITVKLRVMVQNPLPIIDAVMDAINRFLIVGGMILALCAVFAIVSSVGNKLINSSKRK